MTNLSHIILITLVTLYLVTGENLPKEPRYSLKNSKKLRETFNKLIYAVTSVNKERLEALKKFYALQNYVPKVSQSEEEEVAVPNDNVNIQRDNINNVYNIGPHIEPEGTPEVFKDIQDTNYKNGVYDENFMSSEGLTIDISDLYNKILKKEPKGTYKTLGDPKVIYFGKIKDELMRLSSEGNADNKDFYDKRRPREPESTNTIKNINEAYFGNVKDGKLITIVSKGNTGEVDFLRKWKGCNKSAAKACIKACRKVFKNLCSNYKCSKGMKKESNRMCKTQCNSVFVD